uniref:uncharacterized protein LOC124057754 n=1 Tax=Scatophagus argus TaxID=75038 RepID=UPI001ED8396B|nr:uncharacterized protein LOC124057754 [Scatophagus argus]
MPGMCSVPGCKGYKKARSRGVVFHSLPTRDPERCRKWLKAIQNPKFDENTPVSKYGNIRVCSQHFKPEDYEPDIQAELMKTTPRKILKSNVIPSVFYGRQREDLSISLLAADSSRTEATSPSTAAHASTSVVSGSSVDRVLLWPSVLTSIASGGAADISSQSPPPAELSEVVCSVASETFLSESFHQEAELSLTATSQSDEIKDKERSQSKTIVNDSCLMELFKKCQTCGQPISKKKVSHCGAQKKVRWSCLGGHRGVWMSSPHLWDAFPEIHLLMALSVLFSGGAFTHFKKWAKHLHLNFLGHKTFFEIQKAYLNTEMKQMDRNEQEGVFAEKVHQKPERMRLHISDPLKKNKRKSRRGEKEVLSFLSSCEKRSLVSLTSTGTCVQESTALSGVGHVSVSERGNQCKQVDAQHQSQSEHMVSEVAWLQDSFEEMEVTIDEDNVKNRLSDLDTDVENAKTMELSSPEADDSCDEDIYVPVIPQRSTKSELLLECEEEELEPWQKQTSHVPLKDDGEFSNDQTDWKLSLLQRNAVSSSPPGLQTEMPQPVVFSNQGFIVASSQSTRNTELIGSLGIRCDADDSFTIVPGAQQPFFQKLSTLTVKPGACDQISSKPVSLSSVQSPAVHAASSNRLESDQSNPQTLPVPFSLPCFTVLELESSGTSNKQ